MPYRIAGLDVHKKRVGKRIAEAGKLFGLDMITVMFMTPLPGTGLWDRIASDSRILIKSYPADWKYYTLNLPVMRYNHLSWTDMVEELKACYEHFYSYSDIAKRAFTQLFRYRRPLNAAAVSITNLSYKHIKQFVGEYRRCRISVE